MGVNAHVEDIVHLFLQNLIWQAEGGQLAAHEAAARILVIVQVNGVAQRREIAGNGQRGWARTDKGDALTVFFFGYRGKAGVDIRPAVVGADPFQAADRHCLLFHPAAAAGRFAGPVADPAKNTGEDIGMPVQQIRFIVALFADETDILRHLGMGRAGILTIYDLMKKFWIISIACVHACSPLQSTLAPACVGGMNMSD